jgi:ribokinase
MKLKKIAVLGSTNTDMVITGRKIPVPGETVSGGKFLMNPGGKGANQAVAVARLSAKKGACTFIAKVGDDLFGRDTASRLKREGIVPRLVVDAHEPSGTALILVDSKGQNVISVALGANGTLSPADIEPFRKDIEGASVLVMQLETPVETVERAAKAAREKGVTVILNPAPAKKLPKSLYRLVDWITPNETEAEILTGVKVVDAAGEYAPISSSFTVTMATMPAAYDEATVSLVAAEGVTEEAFAAYLKNITKVSVNGTNYNASGRGAVKVIGDDGAVDQSKLSYGANDLVVTSTGYPEFAFTAIKLFTDVTDPEEWYYDAVYWAANEGVTSGYGEGTFQPKATCNRAMMVTFLQRLSALGRKA